MTVIERDDHHGDFDSLPLADRMCLLSTQADDEHIMAWAVEVRRLAQQLAGAVDLLREARAFLDTRHGTDGKLRRPANLIDQIDTLIGGSR